LDRNLAATGALANGRAESAAFVKRLRGQAFPVLSPFSFRLGLRSLFMLAKHFP
jgi:hypothetical protein